MQLTKVIVPNGHLAEARTTSPEKRRQWRENAKRREAQEQIEKIKAADPMFAKMAELTQTAAELSDLRQYEDQLQERVDALRKEIENYFAGLIGPSR